MRRVLISENHIVIYDRLDRVESGGVLAFRINRLGLNYTRLTAVTSQWQAVLISSVMVGLLRTHTDILTFRRLCTLNPLPVS